MNKKHATPAPVGGSALLVIFAVLCLTVFALLTLSTVKADVRMADESTKSIEDYYAADTKAEEILGKLRRYETVDGVTVNGNLYAYSVKVSETQLLSVVVEIKDNNYKIYQWKEIPSVEWTPDKYIEVWGGEIEN